MSPYSTPPNQCAAANHRLAGQSNGSVFIALSMLIFLLGCGLTAEEQAMKRKCESLVSERATTNAVIAAFGESPKFTFTRSQALEHYQKQQIEYWRKMSRYPLTYSFPMYSGDVAVYFDDSGRAVAYYLNVQL